MAHVSSETGLGEGREWGVLGCDGLPYLLAARSIDKNDALKHILMLPGHGHFEMNIQKCIVNYSGMFVTKNCVKKWDFVVRMLCNSVRKLEIPIKHGN